MNDMAAAPLDGGLTTLTGPAITELAAVLSGSLLDSDSPGYDEARRIWNGMIDRRPALIVRCSTAGDVAAAVGFAVEHNLLIAVRGGGHNIAGNAVCDAGLMIDLSPMNDVQLDDAGGVTVGPGCTLAELDAATQAAGRVVPGGIVSSTGVAGLTLGAGFGWLSRSFGMTIDSLRSVNIVLANGTQVSASEQENADLFWGVRGGGGNFGVITSFKFDTHKLGPEVYCGVIVKPFSQAHSYLRFHFDYIKQLPDEMTVWAVVRKAPPLPFLPTDVHGQLVTVTAFLFAGEAAMGAPLIQPLRDFGATLGEHVGLAPYTAWQSAFDGLQEPGYRNYWKSHNFADIGEEQIAILLDAIESAPTPLCEILLPHLGGAVSRVKRQDTAYAFRDEPFLMNVHTRWEDVADDERCIAWARKLHEQTRPFARGVYVNFVSDEGRDRVRDAYPPETWDRLLALKHKYDPGNVFRMNQNITP